LRHIPCRYSKLFDWLVETINAQRPPKGPYTISVLDIFGFEVFDVNSLEQLCINFCNEKLQKNFTDTIFELEQGQYKKEGVAFERVEFVDNHLVISLIESERGILQIIQSVIEIGDIATDKSLFERLKVLKQSPDGSASGVFKDVRDSQFVVKHYAGEVKYSIDGLREKSVLELGPAERLLRETGAPFVRQLLGAHEGDKQRQKEAQGGHGGGGGGKGRKKHTVGLLFKDSLEKLIKTIETTKPHYVRCIKPNMKRSPSDFDEGLTLQQLKCMLARGGLNRKAPFATAAHGWLLHEIS
jgi:myosin heavy subunit